MEDRAPVLDGGDAPGGEAASVPDAVHLIEDGLRRIPGPQEVRMERVGLALVHGSAGRHQRLAQHLPPEDALRAVDRALAPEEVHLQVLQVQQIQQLVESASHTETA